MPISSPAVIVFGPAGGIGRSAAASASRHGAKVWLAMRDTKKTIPGLSLEEERRAGFTRIRADLTDPPSLTDAVRRSEATSAFVYAMLTSEDSMTAAFAALKEAGIRYIVLLSAFDVHPSAQEARTHSFISRSHAEIELKLRESGIDYVALRPAYFNSNLLQMRGYRRGSVQMYGASARHDFIAPEDIGAVAGALLTAPPPPQPDNAIPLNGPEVMDMQDAMRIVGDTLGHEIEAVEIGEEGFRKQNPGIPDVMWEGIKDITVRSTPPNDMYPKKVWEEAVGNIRKYTKREPTTLRVWVEASKEAFE